MAKALRAAADEGGASSRASARRRRHRGSPGAVGMPRPALSRTPGTSRDGRDRSRSVKRLSAALGTPRSAIGNDVQVATNAEFELGAGRPYGVDARRLLGHRRRRLSSTVAIGARPRGGRRDRPRGRRDRRRALPMRAPRMHGGLRGAPRHGGRRRGATAPKAGEHTELFKIMKRKGHDRLKSSVWEHALADGDEKIAKQLLDRAVKALGAGASDRPSTCSTSKR